MNTKKEKQTEANMKERQKRTKKNKGPYNINISFNINNPKKVISNQFNKTIKVSNYSLIPQDQLSKYDRINISKILNPFSKNYSSSLSKSKDLVKQQYLKDLNKYECYLENQLSNKGHKKSKNKSYDIQTKSKSDFTYSTSILSIPFPGNDPLPSAAVKRLNKMKKYFLQKIGSMDISPPEDTPENTSDLINQSQNLKTSQLKLHERKENNPKKMSEKDQIMTQKLSQYQYENLISYENQNDSKQINSAQKSKPVFDYQPNQTFPQIVLDNLNSMTIKNQYLRHHSKFLSENMDLLKKDSSIKKNKKQNKVSFDQLSAQIKSKITNPFNESNRKPQKKQKKQQKSKLLIQNHHSETRMMKQKIKIIQDVLLKSDSSKSILKIGQKSEKSLVSKLETSSRVEEFYKKDLKKQYVIKTEIQLPSDVVKEIKQFETQIFTKNTDKKDNCELEDKQRNVQKELINKISYVQFLSKRDEQVDRKETRDLIQGYIDLLEEHLNINNDIEKFNQESLKQVPSATQIRYLSSEKSQSYQIQPQLSQSRINHDQQLSESQADNSEVSSYIYGDKQQNQSEPSVDYSPERNHKIQLQKQMRQELSKRLSSQFHQKQSSNPEPPIKIILNSNLIEHTIKQNNSDLQYRKQTQSISELEKSTLYHQSQPNQITEPETLNFDPQISHQMDTLLGFIKQNINFNCVDKQVLKDLYEKLMTLSKPQNKPLPETSIDHKKNQSQAKQNRQQMPKQFSNDPIQTPKKHQKLIKKTIVHKRSYSTQKDPTKGIANIVESDDINLWDLILVQERLNKKYNEITYQKQKQLFEIQTDPALTYDQYQQKIDELEKWQNQAKRQILQTKKQIKAGIINLRKVLTPQSGGISFKMKCFSEKQLIPKFNYVECSLSFPQTSNKSNNLGQSEKEIKKNEINNLKQKLNSQNQKLKIQKQTEGSFPKVQVNLDSIFIQQSDSSCQRKEELSSQSIRAKVSQKRNGLKFSQSKEKSDFSQEQESLAIVACSVPQIKLFRTGTSRYKNILQNHETESIGSSKSSNSSEIYINQNIYDQNTDQKQEFIDLLKIEKYKLGNLHQFTDDFQSQSIEDTIQKLPETFSQTTIETQKVSIQNSKITQEDKLDVCEFILLDLCIQMYQETLDLEDSQIRKGDYINSSSHRIIKEIFAFIKKEKKKPKKKGPKIGIHTELQTVKDYTEKIKQYVQSLSDESFNSSDQSSQNNTIMSRMNAPIGPTAVEILKTMRFPEDDVFESREEIVSPEFSQNQGLNSLIIPVYVFTDFEEKLQGEKEFVFDTYFDDPEKQKNRLAFLKNVTHVHHKALFDALNQMLDFQRPWGIWGKPFPWKTKNDKLKPLTQQNLQSSLKKSCDKVIECAMYMCGLLIDKEESLVKNTTVSETYIEEVKQDRMSKMIINDFMQNESRFYFLDDEQTQILLETSYVVWLLLIQEALHQINAVKQRNS